MKEKYYTFKSKELMPIYFKIRKGDNIEIYISQPDNPPKDIETERWRTDPYIKIKEIKEFLEFLKKIIIAESL